MRNHRLRGRRPGWFNGLQLGFMAFVAAFVVALPAQAAMGHLAVAPALVVLLIITLTGIFFDMVGVATAAADEIPFHARASKRVRGARQSLWLVRNADRVAAFANDVVGDIAGTISGAAVAALTFRLAAGIAGGVDRTLSIAGVALVAGLTVGGKAAGKGYAIAHANDIVARTGRFMALWQRKAK
ncbi:MAG: hypothetical protein AB1445_06105 [Bacillota bacterium]